MIKKKEAVASESVYKGVKVSKIENVEEMIVAMKAMIPRNLNVDDVLFLCIGTDRSSGDCLAPLVGMYLEGLGYKNVYGTIDNPVHAVNLADTIDMLDKSKVIIAIDASLGSSDHIGKMSLIQGNIKAGAGVGKDLPEVGDYGIFGCVNISGYMEYHVLQNTRLSRTMKLAKDITSAIINVFPLECGEKVKTKENHTLINRRLIYKTLKKKGMSVEYVK